ncbi:MAG: tRNA pseudouridine(55) synthase TruB [Pseudomonadota bacterium]
MGRTRHSRLRAVDGVLLLNKPAGLSSNQALQRVKRLLKARKAGHTGSLDPAATGMLPLCFGEATKVCSFLLDADKTYRVTARLGSQTDTGDADGKVIDEAEVPALSEAAWRKVLEGFLGESEQIPPMYSALKVEGKRLYELARKGETVERKPRRIRIDSIELLESAGTRLVFRVGCSKGTYVRTLVEDIASAVGTLAHTERLHRERVGRFETERMIDLEAAEALAEDDGDALEQRLLPADAALSGMPAVELTAAQAEAFRHGQTIAAASTAASGLARVYGPGGFDEFLGVGEAAASGAVAPRRVFAGRPKKSPNS